MTATSDSTDAGTIGSEQIVGYIVIALGLLILLWRYIRKPVFAGQPISSAGLPNSPLIGTLRLNFEGILHPLIHGLRSRIRKSTSQFR